ncbi:MAG: hypothetical protein KDA91_08960 [Planctomycetaceae bacterium]|nr:hypothetical protein [Planctomycetaceae bacterium]
MTTVRNQIGKSTYHANAYRFVFSALRFTQEQLGRDREREETGHISGPELLDGVRQLALQHFGMMAVPVFNSWGIHSTDDFGHIVFELIERGEMRKTEHDQLSDFFGVFDFHKAFMDDYSIDTSSVFGK